MTEYIWRGGLLPADLVGRPATGLLRVVAHKQRPESQAKRLLTHISNAQVCTYSPRTLRPVRASSGLLLSRLFEAAGKPNN